MTVGKGRVVSEDNIIRGQQDIAKVGQLNPVFRKTGTRLFAVLFLHGCHIPSLIDGARLTLT